MNESVRQNLTRVKNKFWDIVALHVSKRHLQNPFLEVCSKTDCKETIGPSFVAGVLTSVLRLFELQQGLTRTNKDMLIENACLERRNAFKVDLLAKGSELARNHPPSGLLK